MRKALFISLVFCLFITVNQQFMMNLKNYKAAVNELLGFILGALLAHLSTSIKVEHYSKVVHGKKVFYLLLHAILDYEKLSQQTLENTFNYSGFKANLILMNRKPSEGVLYLRDVLRLILVISRKFLNICMTVSLKAIVSQKETNII